MKGQCQQPGYKGHLDWKPCSLLCLFPDHGEICTLTPILHQLHSEYGFPVYHIMMERLYVGVLIHTYNGIGNASFRLPSASRYTKLPSAKGKDRIERKVTHKQLLEAHFGSVVKNVYQTSFRKRFDGRDSPQQPHPLRKKIRHY